MGRKRPGDGAFAVSAGHGADDDDVAGEADHESDDVRDDDGHQLGIALPRQQHLFRLLHEYYRRTTQIACCTKHHHHHHHHHHH